MRFGTSFSLLLGVGLFAAAATGQDVDVRPPTRVGELFGAPLYRVELLSPVYTIDRIYKSMQGPGSVGYFALDPEADPPEVLWVVAYRGRMTGADGETGSSPEFMCHSNVGFVGSEYHRRFETHLRVTGNRLFTLDQGTLDLAFPEGFGIPVMSNHELVFNPQVLNHNVEDRTLQVRQKVEIDYLRDADLEQPLVPLMQHGVFGLVLIDGPDGHLGVDPSEVDEAKHGPGCSLGSAPESHPVHPDAHGRKFSNFWVVEPGRHTFHTRVTSLLELPYDTTVHYASAHLHPFAESIELRDLTTGEAVLRARAEQLNEGLGLAKVETFSSTEGIPVHKNHEYELVSTYDNTSGEPQDAMATMLLYMRAMDLYSFDFRRSAPRR